MLHAKHLRTLWRRWRRGRRVHLGSRALARKLAPQPEQNTLIRSVCSLRSRIARIVQTRLGRNCGQEDIIATDEQGYHLADGIVVEVYDEVGTRIGTEDRLSKSGSNASLRFDEKQRWVLAQLATGEKLTRRDVEKQFDISERTAKRVRGNLRKAGMIAFIHKPAPGSYQLT